MIPNESPSNQILDTALQFHQWGCSVVPASLDGSKKPAVSWKSNQFDRADEKQIHQWFDSGKVTGLGVVCGKASGGLEMLEMEGRAVTAGLFDEAKALAENSGLAKIWNAMVFGYSEQTPSGGIHWLYRIADLPDGMDFPKNIKIASQPGENGGIDVLVETRGEGGFVITAPSHGTVHPQGGSWDLLAGSPETIPTISWEERESLHLIFKVLDKMPSIAESRELITSSKSLGLPGNDFGSKTSWNEILEPLGWKALFKSKGTIYWRRPGKSEGISATTGRNEADNLYVFTTSTQFEAERPYSKFAAFTLIEFGSVTPETTKHAASKLRKMGFGAIAAVQETPLSTANSMANDLPAQTQLESKNTTTGNSTQQENPIDYENSSWKPEDISIYLDGSYNPIEPTLLRRDDGKFLLYAGKVHSFYGESESGKSWLAQIAAVQVIKDGKNVVILDFESDGNDVILRLRALGATNEEILHHVRYIKPESAYDHRDPYWKALLEPGSADFLIIDGVTEALTMWGGETKDNDDITRWMRLFPRAIASSSGACVVLIDHVTKNPDSRGRFAIGGQMKLAALDGAGYIVEPVEVLAPNRFGSLSLRVTKDRPGGVRRDAGMYRKSDRTQEAAIINVDSTQYPIVTTIRKPLQEEELVKIRHDDLQLAIARCVGENPNLGVRELLSLIDVKGSNDKNVKSDAIRLMVRDGYLNKSKLDRKEIHSLTNDGLVKFGLVGQFEMALNEDAS